MTAPPLPEPEDASEPPLPRYAVRFTPYAARELIQHAQYVEEQTGSEDIMREWYRSMRDAAGSLADNPRRYPIRAAEGRRLRLEVRRTLHKSRGGGVGYHLYYVIEEESPDGPRVSVLHIRHAARRPLTAKEARAIRGSE